MMLFAALAVLMVAAALAFVLWPLLGKAPARGAERGALNVALYKDRSAELELERDDGSLSESEFEQARSELQRDLLVNVDPEPQRPAGTEGGGWMPWAVAASVPVAALALYLALGATDLIDAKAPSPQQAASGMQDVDQALAALRQRLEENPDNVEGWILLGRSLGTMGRHRQAADVYAQAMRAVGEKTDLLLGRAQALAMAQGNRLTGEPIALVRRVLAREPKHLEALWLSGMHAYEQADYQTALDRWLQVKAQVEKGSELTGTVDSAIAQARSHLNAGAAAGATEASPAASATEMQIEVTLAPELAGRMQPNDTLFIFARQPGVRMPVAVERHRAGDLPLSITLDDSATMTGQPLSAFEQLEVVARISKSGSVRGASGDLEGSVTTTPGGAVAVTIDRVVP